jgi:glucose/arabinose dehydrogenase
MSPNGRRLGRRHSRFLVLTMLSAILGSIVVVSTAAEQASALPAGFAEVTAFSGLTQPTVVRFSNDGRVFVAEKSGLIKVFDSLSDTTPTIFADLRTNVHNFWDRGLLGMALHPNFPTTPSVYVLYTYDAEIGGTAPRWGTPGATSDPCPTPPGANGDGCVVSGRLSRLQASGNVMTGAEQVLINDWCQQYPTHSIGALNFGADGMLYASGGDGAGWTFLDYGQDGAPLNPCGDPPGGVGATLTPPTAEGGSLRSQDLRTSDDPLGLDGTVIRVDPDTGAGVPGNPLFASGDANARRVVASGLRNPFRFTHRPGTNEVWLGDVGAGTWEEINRVVSPADGSVDNFGWPCYEGPDREPGFDSTNLNICENLYADGASAVAAPVFSYRHDSTVVPGDSCRTGSSSIAGLSYEFYEGGPYPPEFDGALFFADYSRDCIWVMLKGANGLPDVSTRRNFVTPAANPVDLVMSPQGELFYPDFDGGTIQRIRYFGTGTITCPKGEFKAEYFSSIDLSGPPSLETCEPSISKDWSIFSPAPGLPEDNFSVRWTGTHTFAAGQHRFTATTDDGMRIWLDGQPVIDKWFDQGPTTYTATVDVTAGDHEVKVEFYEHTGTAVAQVSWQPVGNPPTAVIDTPAEGTRWKVNDVISFSGHATDPEDGQLGASALSWSLVLQHCPSNCHTHAIQSFPATASGSFTAPDHDYPSYLELSLTATDSTGLRHTVTRRLDPQTVPLTFQTSPTGLTLTVGGVPATAPFTRTVIIGSSNSITAPSPQTLGATSYQFTSWSDAGAQTHNIVAGGAPTTYTASYSASTTQPFANVNFQPAGSPTVSGYLVDSGGTYAARNGQTYGWNKTNNHARDRNSPLSPDQRYDTLNFMQKGGALIWEMQVPNGQYQVRVVTGDATAWDSIYKVNVEGVLAVNATPTSASRWAEGTVAVTVTDGRLTVSNASGAVNNRICFLDINRVV